jgi:drug/metabolite transporter (DMT)-like permease
MWILFYGAVVCILGFYAIAWQQVLKHLPLITTYANKAITTIWGLIWGLVVFGEQITIQKVIGAIVVIIGVYLVVSGDEEVNGKSDKEEVSSNE